MIQLYQKQGGILQDQDLFIFYEHGLRNYTCTPSFFLLLSILKLFGNSCGQNCQKSSKTAYFALEGAQPIYSLLPPVAFSDHSVSLKANHNPIISGTGWHTKRSRFFIFDEHDLRNVYVFLTRAFYY